MGKNRPKIGLALGSGGFRGLAHIGVIKVLERNNIPIDYIAGSSIGALIGAFYADCRDIKKIEEIALKTDWKMGVSIFDLGRHGGLVKGKKIENLIKKWLGHTCFEHIKIPIGVVATDLSTGQELVVTKGNLVKAIRASFSVPLIFEPIVFQGKLLADGGLVDPVPDGVVKNMGADKVIAVNLENGNFKQALHRKKVSFLKVALRSYNILAWHLAETSMSEADVIISPEVGGDDIVGFGKFFDHKNVKKIIRTGEIAAEKELPKIKKLVF
ncbi:MAG: patatin-like phospholipase family protein [Patescibacteria group bacterium]